MDRRLICQRGPTVAIAIAAALALLAGCASAGQGASSEAPSLQMPSQSEVEAWADSVVPENQTGGASWVAREVVVLRADGDGVDEKAVDVSQSEGDWLVEVACLASAGGSIGVRLETHEGTEDADVACSAPADDPFAPATSLRFAGSGKALLSLTFEGPSTAVYAVYPVGDGER